jgi:hypothetical protein
VDAFSPRQVGSPLNNQLGIRNALLQVIYYLNLLNLMASSELLKQIQAGRGLKKAQTNDRSAPLLDAKPSGGGSGGGVRGGPSSSTPSGSGPPQLGGLFAGGMPKLKSTGQSNIGM